MDHHSESYILYLRARHLEGVCNHLYHSKCCGGLSNYYMKEAQGYLDTIQITLDNLKIAAQKG
jgi:hypothetical protein